MTDPKATEDLAIAEVAGAHPTWATSSGARNQCNIASDAVIARVPGAQRIWVDHGDEPRHCMALLPSGRVVDLTAAQFGTPNEYADLPSVLRTWLRYRISEAHWGGANDWVYRPGYGL